MVSPAPPSKSTLSGTTTAARPLALSRVLMCCTKLSCLLLVVTQKSSRSTMPFSVEVLPSSPTTTVRLFLPKGALASSTSKRSPGSGAMRTTIARKSELSSPPFSVATLREASVCSFTMPAHVL